MNHNDIDQNLNEAIDNPEHLQILLENILSKDDQVRFSSFKTLLTISEKHPVLLYKHWDRFAKMLSSKNSYHQYIAIHLIANLTKIDSENKLDNIFDTYFGILKQGKTMTSGHTIEKAGIIAKFKKQYRSKITTILLNFEDMYKGGQTELMKAAVIQAFSLYFEESNQKEKIIKFVKNSEKSNSPKTRKLAIEFLQKYST
ncbi:MAG: hypothetical protein JXA91_01415 [Candidatus Thermoplasmatota archaeon]|nr:hypothetical protein [Candidatus Thermoplasmatota archaeon]